MYLGQLFVLVLAASLSRGDIYLHNPRGSNNRLDEATRERANDNRLFDSQNNERGGYNVGNLYYYANSKLQVEWTNQHSCKNPNSHCELIIQYMCSDTIRDGSDTKTIPEQNGACANNDCNSDFRFGMHESYAYYQTCKQTSRNLGLFIADQKVGPRATNTRQNPNGQRSGYECPEERDYYPPMQPTPWIDVAILTNDVKRCSYYKAESENVKGRFYCSVPSGYTGVIPRSQTECEKIVYPAVNGTNASWVQAPSHNVDPPECQEAQFTRDNHLGNTYGGNAPVYNWTLPNIAAERCVLRLRYNITTDDYDGWSTFQADPNQQTDVGLNKKVGLSSADAQARGYVLKNNPTVKLFSDLDVKLNLAINTAQYGRVFQDRSHMFAIRQAPAELAGKKIVNLNVRGKRGNIVQVYPAVEYDFVPNKLVVSKDDHVHIQWTGSNTNPANNAGQGVAGSDRSNIVLLSARSFTKGSLNAFSPLTVYGSYGVNYPLGIPNATFLGLNSLDMTKLAILQLNQYGGSLEELNDAGTYFDLGLRQITSSGVYHYMCTRNNNFSNRDQKGEIIVYQNKFNDKNIGSDGGSITFPDGTSSVSVPQGALNDLMYFKVDEITRDQIMSDSAITSNQQAISIMNKLDSSSLGSDFFVINPVNLATSKPMSVKLRLSRAAGAFESASVYRINGDYSVMTKLDANVDSQESSFDTSLGGTYVAKYDKDYSVLIGTLVGVGLLLIAVGAVGLFFFRNPKYIKRFRYTACNIRRSAQSEI